MEVNENLRKQVLGIVDNQLKSNDPPEVKATYDRLRKEKYGDFEAKQLIGQCLAVELFDVLKKDSRLMVLVMRKILIHCLRIQRIK